MTPAFSAPDAEQAEIARAAWIAATECTGWEAPAHPIVTIRRGFVTSGLTGQALVDDDGIHGIEIGYDPTDRALVHEVAHAWVTTGPAALNEGRADLLADCIVDRVPGLAPYDPDPGGNLATMPDLRRWSLHDRGDDDMRSDAYVGSARFARVLVAVLEPRALWPEGGVLRWRDVERMLEREGAAGATVLGVLDGGAERQRAALDDEDHDGAPWLGEVLAGTDPRRWDSDGDGWWDGATKPPSLAAVPLPPDGTPVCTGFAGGADGAFVQVLANGAIRGTPDVQVLAGTQVLAGEASRGLAVPEDLPLLLALHTSAPTAGGAWAMTGGQGLILDHSCVSTPKFTILAADSVSAHLLDAFAAATRENLGRAEGILGTPARRRLVVVLGTGEAGLREGRVELSTGQVAWAIEHGRPDALAAVAVAVHRVWLGGEPSRRWDAAEALARAMVDDPPDLAFVAIDLDDAAAWDQRASACPEGWGGVLDGTCPK